MMMWAHGIAYFFGGAFLGNGIPHFVSGLQGRAFQSPFAKPPGVGLSSSVVNTVWGFFNLVVAYVLLCRVGEFSLRSGADAVWMGAGVLVMGVMMSRYFGKFHGGSVAAGEHVNGG